MGGIRASAPGSLREASPAVSLCQHPFPSLLPLSSRRRRREVIPSYGTRVDTRGGGGAAAMQEPAISSSDDGSSLDEPTWVSWFCMLRNHEFFCEVDPAFVQDRFNLYGLKELVGPLYSEAMTMILGYAPTDKQLADPTQRIHKVLDTARILYGLIHARYILTAQGLSDTVSNSGENPLKLFCARCQELYDHNVTDGSYIDGAFFRLNVPSPLPSDFPRIAP